MKSNIEKIIEVSDMLKSIIDSALSSDAQSKKTISLADRILIYLVNLNACVTPSDIISEFGIKKSNLTVVCNNLIELKYIKKCKSTIDGRAISYTATEEGVKYIQNILNKIDTKVAKHLSESEREKLDTSLENIIFLLK